MDQKFQAELSGNDLSHLTQCWLRWLTGNEGFKMASPTFLGQGFSTKCLVSFYIVFHFQLPCLSFFTWKENSEATKLEISRPLKIPVHNHTGSFPSYSFGQTSHGFKEKRNRLHSLMAGVMRSHCKKVHEGRGCCSHLWNNTAQTWMNEFLRLLLSVPLSKFYSLAFYCGKICIFVLLGGAIKSLMSQ